MFVVYVVSAVVQSVRRSMAEDRNVRDQHRVFRQEANRGSFVRRRGRAGLQAVRAALRAQAVMRGGEFHEYGFLGMPKMTFVHQAGRCLVTVYEGGGSRQEFYTQLTIIMPAGWEHRLEIYRQLFSDEEIAMKGIEDIQVGDAEFDPKYIIKSDAPKVAQEFFTPPVKDAINEIRYTGERDYILISINRERMMVRKAPLLDSVDTLRPFIDACMVLYDRSDELSQRALGIELEIGESDEPPVCQVCGSPIAPGRDRVYCRRCRTPHHLDCWEFNQKCSTYACGEAVFVKRY